ncbi:MAG TPA: ABC transporter permease [Candidatus Limnocylindrales bacterium]|nr:ABC transporter permease [Candidatus Limnocylindrales bacterium]
MPDDVDASAAPDRGPLDVARSTRDALARGGSAWRFLRANGILLALVVLLVAGSLLSPHFLTAANFANVSRQASIVGILAIGMTFVILTAGIDLSVGSILGIVAIGFASMMSNGVPWPVAIAVAIAFGGFVGALNGLGITKGGLQPFIMTLAMLVIARGVTLTFSDGKPIRVGDSAGDIAWIGNGSVAGLPVPVILFALIAVVAWFTLRHTTFGRQVYAVGDNREAARLSGISTNRIIFSAYVISGLCAAVSALIVVSRLAASEPTQGQGFELDAIAIVVIGGTSLFGGSGGVGGTLIGAAIVAAVNNLLNLLGVPPFSQQIAKGLIILGAVLLERRAKGREEGR